MNCMRCGRETVDNDVFCSECLADMDKYPVRPGTMVHLPHRREEPVVKKAHGRRKPVLSPEEQVKRLKLHIRRQRIVLLISTLLLVISSYFTVVHILEQDIDFLPGQNYSSVTSVEETLPE